MKWYVVIETQADGKDYVGINDDSYCGENIISAHPSEDEAEAASIKYAQEQGLPLFADYQYSSAKNDICRTCKCLGNTCRGMSEVFTGCVYFKPISIKTEKAQPASRA